MKHKHLLKSILSVMLITLTTVISIFITSCAEEEENKSNTTPSVYKVSVISGEGGTAKTSETELIPGWEVTITATPEETYRFVNWTVGGKEVSKENPYTIAINQNTQFKANFEKDNYTLKVTAGEGGTVKASQEGIVLNGTKVTLTATPNEGYSFVNWTVNGEEVSKENPYTVTVTGDIEYVANFISYKVTVLSGEGGTAKATKTQAGHNEQVTLTATPNEGYSFVNWTVNGEEVSKENPYTVTVTGDIEYVANFITHKVTVIAGEGGTAETSKTQAGHNEQVTLTATPNDGYSFVNWTVNGEEVSKENPYTVTVTNDIEYVANFISYKVTVLSGEGGTATANKTQVAPNGQVTLTATPNVGYIFVNWTVDDKEVSTQPTYTATITEDTEFKANFIITHKVTAVADEGGTTKVSKSQVEHGGQVTLTATPNEGYGFVNWTVNGVEVSRQPTYTATITANTEFKANFISCKVTVVSGEGGTATANKTQVAPNGRVILTATPNEGYSFVNWTVNGVEVSRQATYTATITANTEFKANFISYKVTVLSGEGGTATANKAQVGYNEQVTLTATPNDGYGFVNWTVNGVEVSRQPTYTAIVTSDIEYKANFISCKVTVVACEGGIAIVNKTQVGYNGQVTLTATPEEDYFFVNWIVNGEEVSIDNPYTATITADTEFKANFKKRKGEENGYVWVDLGLSVKWATCNVGADTSEDYGDYFAWGETSPKTTYTLSTYKYCNGLYDTMTKYCTKSSNGTVDNKTTLELTDDAARVNWGGKWRMPTKAEQDELRSSSNCTWTWTTQNGVKGYKVTSKKNGNSIFLPAAGYRDYDVLIVAGSSGDYCSSSLSTVNSNDAYGVGFNSGNVGWGYGSRCVGQSVRAVCE